MTQMATKILVAVGLLLLLAACTSVNPPARVFESPIAATVDSSPLPAPTPTQAVPETPIGTVALSPVSPGACLQPAQLEASLGRTVCVASPVLATDSKDNDFIMWLDQNPSRTYIAVRNTLYPGVEGTCLQITGKVEKDQDGRVFIRADDPGQIERCK